MVRSTKRCCDNRLNPPWLPRSECTINLGSGRRLTIAMRNALQTSSAGMLGAIA